MLCINCGKKIIADAKFCSNCGINVADISSKNTKDNMETVRQASVISQSEVNSKRIPCTEEQVIEQVFSEIFKTRGMFGKQVYIIGKDTMTPKIKETIKEYHLTDNSVEKPLLVFEYPDMESAGGFVITNQRLVWNFAFDGWQEIELCEIKDVLLGKFLLADVLYIVSYNNERYPKIYLTGMHRIQEFFLKFRKFIDSISDSLYGIDYLTENKGSNYQKSSKKSGSMAKQEKNNINFIVRSCNGIKIDSVYCEIGSPINPAYSKRYEKAKVYFNITDNEEIFLIYDATVFGNCKQGFALCTNGFYYCEKKSGYLDWNQFRSVKISKSFFGLTIGDVSFNCDDCKKIMMVLQGIQEYLR